MNVKDIRIGDKVYVHDSRRDPKVYSLIVKHIFEERGKFFVRGIERSIPVDRVYRTKDEALKVYLEGVFTEIIKIVKGEI